MHILNKAKIYRNLKKLMEKQDLAFVDAPFGRCRSICVECGGSDDTYRNVSGVLLIIGSQKSALVSGEAPNRSEVWPDHISPSLSFSIPIFSLVVFLGIIVIFLKFAILLVAQKLGGRNTQRGRSSGFSSEAH